MNMPGMPFDPQAFLDLPAEAPFEKRILIAVGDYTATIQDLVPRQWASKTKTDDAGNLKSGVAYDIKLVIDVPESERTRTNMRGAVLTLEDGVMVDMKPDGTGFDFSPGRNRRLMQYREALDQNKAGEIWRPRQMIGKVLKVRVTHAPIERDGVQTGDFREAVGALARA